VEDLEQALSGDGKIEVLKRSGDWSSFTVKSLGRPFDVDGVKMCYGYADEGNEESGSDGAGVDGAGSTSGSSGSRGGSGGGRQGPARGDGGGRSSGGSRSPGRHSSAAPPPPDDSEPLPDYQGGPEDEWQGF
jgi:hypothetical protein